MPFRSTNIKDAEIFFVEEKDVSVRELALGTVVPTDPGKTTIKGINQNSFSKIMAFFFFYI